MTIREISDTIDTPGGHILVALFIVVNGILLAFFREDIGKLILGEGLGCVFTLLRAGKTPEGSA